MTTKLYKLTDQNNETQNHTKWGENITHTADGKSDELCNNHWIHAYADPLLSILMNPIHADFKNPKLWECQGEIGLEKPDKIGCTSLTTLIEIPLPEITTEQKVKFACLCAKSVYHLWEKYDKSGIWLKWYNDGCKADAAWAAGAAGAAAWAAWAARDAAGDAGEKLDLVKLAYKAIEE